MAEALDSRTSRNRRLALPVRKFSKAAFKSAVAVPARRLAGCTARLRISASSAAWRAKRKPVISPRVSLTRRKSLASLVGAVGAGGSQSTASGDQRRISFNLGASPGRMRRITEESERGASLRMEAFALGKELGVAAANVVGVERQGVNGVSGGGFTNGNASNRGSD